VSERTGRKAVDQQLRDSNSAQTGPCPRALGPARENICALKFLKGYIVCGCWELKEKFRLESVSVSSLEVE